MSAPTLTIKQQKSTLSGRKKKNKTVKNILGLPQHFGGQSVLVSETEAEKLIQILGRLLPATRYPTSENNKIKNGKQKCKRSDEENKLWEMAKSKRNQLCFGINELRKDIEKNLISCAVLANDIQPKFLTYHLVLLCNHKQIPVVYIPGLREVTKQHAGVPSISIGFKKNSTDFSEAVEEVISISKKSEGNDADKSSESSDSDDEILDSSKSVEINTETNNDTPSFTYLYRKSIKERAFTPVSSNPAQKTKLDFISIKKDDEDEIGLKKHFEASRNVVENQRKLKHSILTDLDTEEVDLKDEFGVPKKKSKANWFVDTSGTKQSHHHSNKTNSEEETCVAENSSGKLQNSGFISLEKDDKTEMNSDTVQKKPSSSGNKNKRKMFSKDMLEVKGKHYVPKKKPKKNWFIDTVGNKKKPKYSGANVLRVNSNPDRVKNKRK